MVGNRLDGFEYVWANEEANLPRLLITRTKLKGSRIAVGAEPLHDAYFSNTSIVAAYGGAGSVSFTLLTLLPKSGEKPNERKKNERPSRLAKTDGFILENEQKADERRYDQICLRVKRHLSYFVKALSVAPL